MTGPSGGHTQWSFLSKSRGNSATQGSLFLFPSSHAATGQPSIRGLLAMKTEGWAGLETPADYERLLRREYPTLPDQVVREVRGRCHNN
jgi:hypothetical protein